MTINFIIILAFIIIGILAFAAVIIGICAGIIKSIEEEHNKYFE